VPAEAIRSIDFHPDGSFELTRDCKNTSCQETGSYVISDAVDTLRLTNGHTREETSLPFAVTTPGTSAKTRALHPLDQTEPPAAPPALVSPVQVVRNPDVGLIVSQGLAIAGTQYTRSTDGRTANDSTGSEVRL
jgi:hypothetical protein